MKNKLLVGILLGITLLAGCGSNAEKKVNDTSVEVKTEAVTQETKTETSADTSTETVEAQSTEAEDGFVWTGDGLNEAKTIRIGYQPTASYHLQAFDESWKIVEDEFKKDGIEIEWVSFNYGPPIIEAMAAGEIDLTYGIGDTPTINGIAAENPVIAIGMSPIDRASYGIVINTSKASDVTSLKDLAGHTIALKGGSSTENRVLTALREEGVERDDLAEIVNIAATNDLYAAVKSGEVDAIGTTTPNWEKFTLEDDLAYLSIEEHNRFAIGSLFVANTDFANKNPELVARFLKTVILTNEKIQEDREKAKEIISLGTGYDVDILTSVDRWEFQGSFNEDSYISFQNTIDALKETSDLVSNIDPTQVGTNLYIERANELLK